MESLEPRSLLAGLICPTIQEIPASAALPAESGVYTALQAEGEGEEVKFRVVAVKVGTPDTSGDIDLATGNPSLHPGNGGATNPTPATTLAEDNNGVAIVEKGSEFELRFYVQDVSSPTSHGVFSGFFDVDYNAAKVTPIVNEVQTLDLISKDAGGSNTPFTGGDFTVTYAGQTVTVTPVFSGGTLSRAATSNSIKSALAPLVGGAGNLDVVSILPPVPSAPFYRWEIRFKGALQDQNLAAISAEIANLQTTAVNKSVAITEFNGQFTGTTTDTNAFRRAFLPSPALIADGENPNLIGAPYTSNVAVADASVPDVLNEVGTFGSLFGPKPGTTEREFLRIRMQAIETTEPGQPIRFQLSPADLTGSKTLLVDDPSRIVLPSEIDYGAEFLLEVRETLSARSDQFTAGNAVAVANGDYDLNVFADNGGGADVAFSEIQFEIDETSVAAMGDLGGQLEVLPGNQLIRYSPPEGYAVASPTADPTKVVRETFTYAISGTLPSQPNGPVYHATATVTINLIEDVVFGDVNADGGIDPQDVVFMVFYFASFGAKSMTELPYGQTQRADLNFDGSFDSQDVLFAIFEYKEAAANGEG